jgi:hypothetical protein
MPVPFQRLPRRLAGSSELRGCYAAISCHLVASGAGAQTINRTVTALRFLFIVTLRKPQVVFRLPFIREPRKLPIVLSPEEGGTPAGCGARSQLRGGAECPLRRGIRSHFDPIDLTAWPAQRLANY